MKKTLFSVVIFLVTTFSFCACSDDDNDAINALVGNWVEIAIGEGHSYTGFEDAIKDLQSSPENWYETSHSHYGYEVNANGTGTAWEYNNSDNKWESDGSGKFTIKENILIISYPGGSKEMRFKLQGDILELYELHEIYAPGGYDDPYEYIADGTRFKRTFQKFK